MDKYESLLGSLVEYLQYLKDRAHRCKYLRNKARRNGDGLSMEAHAHAMASYKDAHERLEDLIKSIRDMDDLYCQGFHISSG